MTSQKSLFKINAVKSFFMVNLKRFIWLPVLNLLSLLLFLPVFIISYGPKEVERILDGRISQYDWTNGSWFYQQIFNNPLLQLILIGVAILWAAILFNYLNESKTVTFFHSLPLSRQKLFINLNFVGAMGMLIPVVITAICCLALRFVGDLGLLYSVADVFLWMGTYFILELVFYSSAVFVGMVTGLPLVQPIFTLILHGLPVALYGLTALVLHQLVYGLPNYANYMSWAEYLPIISIFNLYRNPFTLGYIISMILLIVLFMVIGLWLYQQRPLEKTGDIIVFTKMRPLFKYGLTYCAMISGGLVLSEVLSIEIKWWMLLLWSIVGYSVAEMLLQKTVRILKSWKGLTVYILLIGFVLVGFKTDLFGYQRRIPQLDQIAAVHINGSDQTYAKVKALEKIKEKNMRIIPQLVESFDPRLCFQDVENVEAMQKVHQELINKKEDKDAYRRRNNNLTYILKDGSVLKRQYNLNLVNYPDLAKSIYESAEYKTYRRNISFASSEDMAWLRLSNSRRQGSEAELFSTKEIDGLLAALKADIYAEPFESIEAEKDYYYRLEYRYKMPDLDWQKLQEIDASVFNSQLEEQLKQAYEFDKKDEGSLKYEREKYDRYDSISIPGTYNNTLKWIKDNGYWDKLKPTVNSFSEVRLYKGYNFRGNIKDQERWEKEMVYEQGIYPEIATVEYENRAGSDNKEYVSIDDQNLIGQILTNDSYKPYFLGFGQIPKDQTIYCLDFYSSDQQYVYTGYYYNAIPDFLEDYAAKLD